MDRLKELLIEDVAGQEPSSDIPEDEGSNFIEVISYSIEEGLETASKKLNIGIADLEYEILDKGSNGFLGIGRKPFKLLVKSSASKVTEELQELTSMTQKMAKVEVIQDIDGSYKVRITKNGIMVIVKPPIGKGRIISFQEVKNALYQKQILNPDENLIKKIVTEAKGEPVKIGEWQSNPEYDGRFSVEVSEDEMKAYMTLVAPRKTGRVVDMDDIISELERRSVVYGIKLDTIKEATEEEKYNQPILIAEGDFPKEGEDSKIDYKFKVDKEVQLSEDEKGRVDFRELDLIENVVVGQVLAKKIPASQGVAGKTVTGRELPAKDGRDVPLTDGKNTKLNDDKTQLAAEINGQVVYVKGRINVEPVYEVKGDVSLETGNVVFLGTVIVRGNVEDGFSIKAAGNIDIKGSVGKAQLEAEGDIVIKQGLLGKDEALIVAGNDIVAKFVEHAKRLEAGRDIIIGEGLMHSFVDAGKRVICNGKRAMIVGGRIRAGEEINAKVIGSQSYTETEIEVGIDPKSRQQLMELNEELRNDKDKTKELSMNITTLENQKRTLGGKLPPEKEEVLIKMLGEKEELNLRMNEIEEQIVEIKSYLASIEEKGKVCVQKEVFPKVRIIVKDAFLEVKDSFKYVTFIQEAGNIKVLPYEEPKLEKGEKLY